MFIPTPDKNERRLKYALIGLGAALILSMFSALHFHMTMVQRENMSPPPDLQTEGMLQGSRPLLPADETALQGQLQDILAKGTEDDCEVLSDERYQFACHDFFKIRNKK